MPQWNDVGHREFVISDRCGCAHAQASACEGENKPADVCPVQPIRSGCEVIMVFQYLMIVEQRLLIKSRAARNQITARCSSIAKFGNGEAMMSLYPLPHQLNGTQNYLSFFYMRKCRACAQPCQTN